MRKNVDYSGNPEWLYCGDISAERGGIWIKHCGDYAEAIEITDLDSAVGFNGAVMIERKSVGLYVRQLSEAKKRIRSALSVYGWTYSTLRRECSTKERRKAEVWRAMLAYGYGDSDIVETLQLEPDGPMAFDGWTADRTQTRGDIGGYVMAKYLD